MKITTKAHAKINWSLRVCGTRADGYHELDMLMQSIELADELSMENARRISLRVNGHEIPPDGRNLVVRAAMALNDLLGSNYGARISLVKRIPARAGLGGGSADCAAALKALNRLWNLHLPPATLAAVGLKLGADVPFCLQGGLCRAQGVGEILTPCAAAPALPLVLITPGDGLSTPQVFSEWDRLGGVSAPADPAALADALNAGDRQSIAEWTRNDLTAPAVSLMPEIETVMDQLRAQGAQLARMSGSGSTVFGVFESDEAAQRAAAALPGAVFTRTMANAHT